MHYSHLCQTGEGPPGSAKTPASHMITNATAPPPPPFLISFFAPKGMLYFTGKRSLCDYSNKHYINNKWNAIESELSWTLDFGLLPKAGRLRHAKATPLTS